MENNRPSYTLLLLAVLFFLSTEADRLFIERIRCVRMSSGVDPASRAAFGTIGAIVASGATAIAGGGVVIGTGGAAIGTLPVTYGAIASAATGGSAGAIAALDFIDTSIGGGSDNIFINVNGAKVFPPTPANEYFNIKAGETRRLTNVYFDFNRGCRIQVIEYDLDSGNDNLGFIEINSDEWNKRMPGRDYSMKEAVVIAKGANSLYLIDFRVQRNSVDVGHKWMFCGTATCKACTNPRCETTSNYGVDRDKDTVDLLKCPYPMVTRDFKKYPQTRPAADVYLRICSTPGAPDDDYTWKFCGTTTCKGCPNAWCEGTSNSGLDRDKDKVDLRACPHPMATRTYRSYPQIWPAATVYLRVCSIVGAPDTKYSWMFCGTTTCKGCVNKWCEGTSNSGLDRDKDKVDLKQCPFPYIHRSFKVYNQFWPFADVFLRICSLPGAK